EVFGKNSSTSAEKLAAGFIKYKTGDFLVYFNATSEAKTIDTTGYTKLIDVSSGSVNESGTIPPGIPAKSFVILKK
ncbi:MAG: hypothetical protein ACTTI5_08985, partial [Treponema sp.]